MGRDETTSSMVSDTWSMDVLASDNELLDQSDRSQISVQLPPPLIPLTQTNPVNQQVSDSKYLLDCLFINYFNVKLIVQNPGIGP